MKKLGAYLLSALSLFAVSGHFAYALVALPPPPLNWSNVLSRTVLSWSWGTFEIFQVVFFLLILVIFLGTAFFIKTNSYFKELGDLLKPTGWKIFFSLFLFLVFLFLSIIVIPLQGQWFSLSQWGILIYLPNLIAFIVAWYLVAVLLCRIERIKILVFILIAFLALLGFIMYCNSNKINLIDSDAFPNIFSIAPLNVNWDQALFQVNRCEAAVEAVDPYVVLKDGQILILNDPPGYEAMLSAEKNASPQCGHIPVVPN